MSSHLCRFFFKKRKIHYPAKCQQVWIIFILPQVRFVRIIFFHRFFVGKNRKRNLLDLFCGYNFLTVKISISSIRFITSFCSTKLISKSSWGKFRSPVPSRIFISQTFGNLEIPFPFRPPSIIAYTAGAIVAERKICHYKDGKARQNLSPPPALIW